MITHKFYSAVLALTLTAASFAAEAADAYSISIRLSHNGKEFGAPSAVVMSGVPATIGVTGPDGYKLQLTVTGDGPDRIKISTRLDTTAHGSIAPEVIVRPGQAATVSVGGLEMGLTAVPYATNK